MDPAPQGEPPPKPYNTPPGFKPPTLGEQFRYAARRHPYARYGYAGAVLLGLIGYGAAAGDKRLHPPHPPHPPPPPERGAS